MGSPLVWTFDSDAAGDDGNEDEEVGSDHDDYDDGDK